MRLCPRALGAAIGAASVLLAAHSLAAPWQELGPSPQLRGSGSASVSGRVSALAYSPDYNGQGVGAFYLGAAGGGVWRSTDFESANPHWTPLTDDLGLLPQAENGAINVGSIAVDPFHPNTIYVGTGEASYSADSRHGAGILKSTDGGDTWTLLAANIFGRQSISRIFVDPTDNTGQTLYCSMVYGAGSPGATRGIFKSTTGGITWSRVSAVLGSSPKVTDMEYTLDQNGAIVLYAGVDSSGVWLSVDNGASWTKWTQTSTTGRISLAADHTPGASPAVYAVTESSPGDTGPKVYVSRNHGASWTATNDPGKFAGGQGWYDLAIALAPDGRVTLGGVSYPFNKGLMESVDGGANWASIDVGTNGIYPHTDHHAFLWVNGKLYNGNDGGIFRFTPVAASSQTFGAPVTTNVSGGAARLATADMNNDGVPDVVVTGDTTNRVTVLLGRGDGQFGAPLTYSTDAGPVGVAIADINQDGIPDVVTANAGANSISVMMGVGNGSLQLPTNIPVGRAPVAVAVADMNGDGLPDIVTANQTDNNVTILLQNTDGSFTAATVPVGIKPGDVKVADLNGDGIPDIVTPNSLTGDVSVLTMALDGSYSSMRYAAGSSPVAVAIGDLNGDGRPEIAIACQTSNWVAVLMNNGSGFDPAVRATTGSRPSSVAIAEVTGDAYPDIITANLTGTGSGANNTVSILSGSATGSLGAREDVAAGKSPVWLDTADFNGDTHKDIAVVNAGTAVSVLLYGPSVNPGGGPGKWESLNTPGLGTIQIQGVALHPTNPQIALEGSQDNGTARRVGNLQWSSVSGGDGGIVRFDPNDGNIAYKVAPQGSFGSTQFFQYSSNGGVSWAGRTDTISGDFTFPLEQEDGPLPPPMAATGTAFPFYPYFTVNPDNGARLAIGSTRVYQSTNRALNWNPISPALNGTNQVSCLAYAPGYPQTLYAGFGNGALFRTTDGGATWPKLVSPWGNNRVSGIAVDAADPNTVFVAISTGFTSLGRVWKTTNGGASWLNVSVGLPYISAQSIVQDPRNRNLYLGMDLGMWASQDDGRSWIRWGTGLANAQVLDVQINTRTNLLAAGTHGRGAWAISIAPGDINGDGTVDATDASMALGIWGGFATATQEEVFRANVLPDSPGIQIDDVVAIVRAAGGAS